MHKKDIFRMCMQNLTRHRSRTFLTVLGVLIGCCSIVIMVSLGIGMKESQERMLAEMGDLTIITVTPPQNGKGKIKLNDETINKLKRISGVEAVSPRMSLENYTIKLYAGAGNRYVCDWTTVAALDPNEITKLGYKLISGNNVGSKTNDVLTGQYFAYSFYDTMRPQSSNRIDRWASYDESGNENPLPNAYFDPLKTPVTMEVDTGSGKFTVLLNPKGQTKEDYSKGDETSEGIIMSINDLKKIIEKAQGSNRKPINYSSAIVKVSNISQVAQVEKEIKAMHFNTSSMESIRKPMEKEARQKQMLLGGLGAISLFVAALGITNTMIMSISERTREIGIMKSLGCYIRDIRLMFLAEAGAIGLIGGIIGCVISLLISVIINLVSMGSFSATAIWGALVGGVSVTRLSVIPPWLMVFALVFSVGIGLGSGYYPANKATKISALEAIKSN